MIQIAANADLRKRNTRAHAARASHTLQRGKAGDLFQLQTVVLDGHYTAIALCTEEFKAMECTPYRNDGAIGEWNGIGQPLKLSL